MTGDSPPAVRPPSRPSRRGGHLRPDDVADAEGSLALAWLEEGNLLEAQQAIARADQRLQVTEDRLLR